MNDPYSVLGISPESDDETIRKRYLELVREFSPELHPQRFSMIRAAYDHVRDLDRRVAYRLEEQGKQDNIEQIIEEVACRTSRRRYNLQTLLEMSRKVH
ncbi:MAG: J domain-containing protein [Planctomycetes bacterium]|nr:J domain-containing protein [Planctomycetota bacterium]